MFTQTSLCKSALELLSNLEKLFRQFWDWLSTPADYIQMTEKMLLKLLAHKISEVSEIIEKITKSGRDFKPF